MNHNDLARSIYSKSLHPQHGYPFAIVGIHITSSIHKLLIDGHLKTHFYQNQGSYKIEAFYEVFGKINKKRCFYSYRVTIHEEAL